MLHVIGESIANIRGMQGAEMKAVAATLISISLFVSATSGAQTSAAQAGAAVTASTPDSRLIEITRIDFPLSNRGSAQYFTGSVEVEELFAANNPSRASGGKTRFAPGVRSAWHTHPLGQILLVTDGLSWIQQWGGPIEEIRKGDIVWIPAGVKHWHGATP